MMKPSRPTGIAVLAILNLIGGIIAVIGGIFVAAVAGSGIMSTLGYGSFSGIVAVFGGIVIVAGIFAMLVGWGMWSGKAWAWYLAVILYALGALSSFVSLIGGAIGSIIGLLIGVFLLWYMLRPHVQSFFGRGVTAQPISAPQPAP